ncbi:MAG: septum site-determining protein MinD [Clostridia bacterium]|nr:septum site-determining protein MinD [Clostridia bacterium]
MGEAIVVTSGKGGAGKTTLSANLGAALALEGHKVLLVDTDIGLRNLDVLLGFEDKIVYDLVDICTGNCDAKKATIKDKRFENLYFVPASQAKEKDAITPLQMRNFISEVKEEYDYIIIDCPAGLEQGFENAVALCDRAIVVAMPEMTSVRDADRIIGLIEQRGIEKTELVINRMRKSLADKGVMLPVEEILEILAVNLIGVVPEDERIIAAANCGTPCVLDEKSMAGKAYKNIAKRVKGEEVSLLDISDKRNVFVRIIEAIKN